MAQHPMKVVLLDLDGTLTKSDGGIIASVVKTFEELGRPVPDDAELHRFIGPAIIESLRRNHVPEDELDRAVTIYRSYYADRAVFDDPNEPGNKVPGRLVNVVFPGIREQLLKLRADGYYLALASCKPEYQCVPICEHFHLTELLDGIYGASRDNSRLDKEPIRPSVQGVRLRLAAVRQAERVAASCARCCPIRCENGSTASNTTTAGPAWANTTSRSPPRTRKERNDGREERRRALREG